MTMADLAHCAAKEQMIPNAPVQAARSVRIAAPVIRVWSLLTEVSDCERWYPYLKKARLEGAFCAGTPLIYGGWIKHKLRIGKLVRGN